LQILRKESGTGSIKDNQIRETEHRFNREMYSSSAGAV